MRMLYILYIILQYHLQICADRDNDFLKKFTIGQEQNDTLPELMKNMAIPAEINIPNEENWDEVSCLLKIECEEDLLMKTNRIFLVDEYK